MERMIETDWNFILGWIFRATGRTPNARMAPKTIMFKTGNMIINETTSKNITTSIGGVRCFLMSIPILNHP